MTVITAAIATAVQISGLPATTKSAVAVDLADPVIIYGLPAVVREPTPTPSPAPDAVQARVLDFTGTFICNLPHAQGLRWMDEFNTAGAGSIDVHRYDDVETAHPTVWNPGNQILISVGGIDVFRLILDADGGYRIDPDTAERIDTWGGTGALGVLNSGMCAPEYGWRPEATEERSFDYGSNPTIGGWLVPSEWHTPVGKPIRKSWRWTYKKRHLPKKWPDKKAEWLWFRNPDSTSGANETCYFRGSFTLAQPRRVKIWVAGDDTLEFQLDGEVRITNGPGSWKKASTLIIDLDAGVHYVAAKVENKPGSTGNQNRSGFICSIARMNGNHEVAAWLLRTKPSTWTIRRRLTGPPGWRGAQVILRLVQEQQARGCAGHSPVTFGFTTAADSSGVGWVDRQELSVTVGTLALDYIQEMVETGLDVAMTPGLQLNVWRSRGSDRSGWVRLDQGTAHAMDEAASQLPAIRNVAYARALTGWVGESDAGSVAARGRRETVITLGSSRSLTQTAAAIGAMLPDMATPPQTVEAKFSGADGGPQPYRDYFVGDWVSYRPAGASTWGRYRVMSISGEPDESNIPDWTTQLYEDAA